MRNKDSLLKSLGIPMRILCRKVHWISFEMSCETLESSINQSSVSTFTSVEHLFSKVQNFILQNRSIHFVVHYAFVRRHLVRYQLALQELRLETGKPSLENWEIAFVAFLWKIMQKWHQKWETNDQTLCVWCDNQRGLWMSCM